MKEIFISIAAVANLCLSACGSAPGTGKESNSDGKGISIANRDGIINGIDTASYIVEVKNYLDSVNTKINSLSLHKVDVFGESAEGGEIEIYSSHSDTLRLRAVYYGETGKREYDLYFRNQNLVVFRETANYYNAPIGETQVNVDSTMSTTFILHENRVIKGTIDKHTVDSVKYAQKASDILHIYNDIKKQLKDH